MAGPISYEQLFQSLGPGAQELKEFTTSVQGLNRNYKNLAKSLDADAQRIATGLATVQASLQATRNGIAQTNVSSEKERGALQALSAQVAALAREQDNYKKALDGQNTVRGAAKKATDELTASLKRQQQGLKEAYAAGDIARMKVYAARIVETKAATDQLSKAIRGTNSELTAVSGSYNRLALDTKALGDQIRAMPGGFDATNAAAQKLKLQFYDNTQKLKDFDRELNQNFREVGSYAKGILEAVSALERQKTALQADTVALQQQQRATGLTADQQNKLQAELEQTQAELGKVNGQLRQYGVQSGQASGFTANIQKGMGGLVQSFAGAYYGLQGLATGLQQLFEKNVQYSDQAVAVRKTTGQTAEEFDNLATNLKKLDTRTSLSGLLDIAKVGGQLGKSKDEIEGYTKAIDVAVQALGDDFSGGAEQIATELGKIEMVFRKTLGPDQNQNLLDIGSAINEIGAEGAATAPFLTDVALRVGATAANARLGLKDVLAYAAVLQETGSNAETSGTALNRLFNTLSTKTQESFAIAKLANSNLTLTEFRRLVNTDFQGAIQLFLRGLNAGGTNTTKFNRLLGTLKLSSGEAKNAITTLAKNTELFAERQKTANEQLQNGTSLAEEAALVNDNLAGSWEKTKKSIVDFVTDGAVGKGLKSFLDDTRRDISGLVGLLGKAADGFTYLATKAKLVKPVSVEQFGATAASTKALLNQAEAAEKLLNRYEELAGATNRSAGQEQEMADAALKLQKTLGASVVSLDKETGKFKLNTGATRDAIAARQALATQNERVLVRGLKNAESAVEATQKLQAKLTEQVSGATAKLDLSGMSAERRKELEQAVRDRQALRDEFGKIGIKQVDSQGTQMFSKKELDAAQAMLDAEIRLKDNGALLKKQQQDVANAQAALNSVRKAGTKVVQEVIDGEDTTIEKDKEKKKSIADVAKAEYELQKQRLEARLADLNRQAENPANSEEVRLDATRKAADVRRSLAKLERDELIREAAQSYKDQINGQQALEKTRIRLREAFAEQMLGIERDLTKDELALRNSILDQLGEVDKLILQQEIDTLDLIAQNEQNDYQTRQQAALDASARRLEIIEIEYDARIRAAKGNAEEIAKIEADTEAKRKQALTSTRPFNSDLANSDLAKQYVQDQLALENQLAAGLISKRDYYKELRRLDNDYSLQQVINLQKDGARQIEADQAALQRARELQQKKDELRQHEGELIIEGLQNLQQLSDSFFEIGAQRRNRELQDVQLKKDAELKVAGENEELKAQIEETFRKRELAIKQKQAKADKTAALFNVALNTAMAVTSVLSTGGGTRYADFGISAGILSAIVIAQGLAQAAAIVARPIPQYFKGRDGGPAEWAMVGERGAELVSTPSGGAQMFAGPTVTYLPQGATVHTASETRDIVRENRFINNRLLTQPYQQELTRSSTAIERLSAPVVDNRSVHALAEANRRENDRLIKAWYERPEYRMTEDGMQRFERRGSNIIQHTNKRHKRND
ncbi:phage tail tape measure protein, TP901 family, core region [Hymenobacter gelipurpurascens]|uniref:Phage tail tape measure protein, TP901 family, core region n=1 Tax=Hymenobacter gelipurpurascens TaxID=89968 RepID=A0A212T8S6_9BACT|nr:phage tail tape measure protein [Hymenobacter gelipurpurascens]SNC62241.1 phage tail tape measure protein, TP901 family, core region [Hymenobacter gelipurpurascens]